MKNLKDEIQSVVNVYKSGNLTEAETLSKKLLIANPKVVFLYNLLGLILSEQKKTDQAIECYEKGIKVDPTFAMIYNNLGQLYFRERSSEYLNKSKELYEKSISLDKRLPEPLNNLGNLYSSLNKNEEAIELYKKAIGANPKFYFAYYNLGIAFISIGNFSEAKKNLEEAIKLNPQFSNAHRSLSRITKYDSDNKHFLELKKMYELIDEKNTPSKIDIAFALGKACEDIKDFNKSFFYYQEANFYTRKTINFSIKEENEKFDEIKSTFDKKLFNQYQNTGYKDSYPIFIIGMPRSGTTLIEQILSSHPKVFGADEVEFLPNVIKKNFGNNNLKLFFEGVIDFKSENFDKIGLEYDGMVKNISNDSERVTDKLPTNFKWVGLIKLILPNAKIIHCTRNSHDNCLSIFKNHFTSGKVNFAYNLNEIVDFYNLYSNLMNYWNDLLPDFIFNINYENLINNADREIKKLLKFCNLEWSDSCLNFYKNKRPIRTASDVQARSKIYKTSIGSWKNYEKHLKKTFLKLDN
tara:strand:- start:7077 stop:8645 length:1569 start_codon:yes stop_codon:yes gene_type:complete